MPDRTLLEALIDGTRAPGLATDLIARCWPGGTRDRLDQLGRIRLVICPSALMGLDEVEVSLN